jgi:predicted component of type VI protein secretion system
MSIQSNLNQAMSIAGLLYNQSAAGQAKAEARKEQRHFEKLGRKEELLTKAMDTASAEGKTHIAEELDPELRAVQKERFSINPTEETLGKLTSRDPETGWVEEASPEEIAQERWETEQKENEVNQYLDMYRQAAQTAQQHLAVRQDEIRNSRMSFLDEPTSLGGTVKDLDPKLRELIADQLGENWEFGQKGVK